MHAPPTPRVTTPTPAATTLTVPARDHRPQISMGVETSQPEIERTTVDEVVTPESSEHITFDDATLATLDEEEVATLTSQGEDEDLIGTDQLPLDELLKPAEDAKPKAHFVVKMLALGALVLGVAAAASRRRNDDLHYA